MPPSPAFFARHRSKLGLALALILGLVAWALWGGNDKNAENRTTTVTLGTIEDVVTAQGKLEPKEYVDVGAQVSGQLKKIHFEIGQDVKQGDLLAEIDPRIYEARVEASTAQLRSLKAQLAEQQANLELAQQQQARNERLMAENAISRDALDQTAAALKVAQAKVGSQRAQIQQTESTLAGDKTNLEYTKIFAPMTGTVVTLPTREGQTLNANQTTPTVMQLAELDTMTVRTQVAEADVMRLQLEMPVYFTTLGAAEKKLRGTIRQIQPTPDIVNDVVLYNVLVDVDNKNRELMNGMSTQVFFVLGTAENVPLLPLEALGRRVPEQDNASGKAYMVKLQQGRRVEEKLVQVGLMNRIQAEMTAGVQAGDVVIITAKPAAKNTTPRPPGMGPRL